MFSLVCLWIEKSSYFSKKNTILKHQYHGFFFKSKLKLSKFHDWKLLIHQMSKHKLLYFHLPNNTSNLIWTRKDIVIQKKVVMHKILFLMGAIRPKSQVILTLKLENPYLNRSCIVIRKHPFFESRSWC